MKTRALRTGLELTEFGFGAAQIGNLYTAVSDEAAEAAVNTAWESGVRYFDTAPHYGLGLSERRLGRALAKYPRDEFVLSTKVGRLLEETPENAGEMDNDAYAVRAERRRVWDFSRDGVRRSIEASLERTGLGHFDIVYLHDPDQHWEVASATGAPALAELRDEGVINAFGAGMNQSEMLERFIRECDADVVMCASRFTLLEQGALDDVLPAAQEHGASVVAAAPYNTGLLSRDVVPDQAKYDYGDAPAEQVQRAREIATVCASHGVSLPAAAVQFALRHPSIVSVVAGVRTVSQATSSIQRLTAPIPEELWRDLNSLGLTRYYPEEDPA
ncbi:aldo/keto reductase [Demequina oxidasica]|uniref:aldo/keto reductase n=1 Tax=Demequina oxidasica TaxID=676199 RepID=UPI0007856558|nr:aldo/keto reductase [Demequina oxidasica]